LNRSSFAFFVALLVHILLILLFLLLGSMLPIDTHKNTAPKEKKIKISLKDYKPKKHKNSGNIKKKPTPIAPPMPKGSQLKQLAKKPPIKYKPKKHRKKVKLNPKPKLKPKIVKPKPKIKPLPPKKPYIALKKTIKDINITKDTTKTTIKKQPKDPLYALLSQDRSNEENKQQKKKNNAGSNIGQNIKELYGDKFGKLTPGQQKYILNNQEIMRRITQQVLTRVARVNLPNNLRVNATNIIEFYLYPNGDMSDFRFIKKSGYYVLDDTTKETIEYAYSRYPRPTEKTLIRYNVFYNLASY